MSGTVVATTKRGELMPPDRVSKLIAIEELRREASTEIAKATAAGNDMLKGLVVARSMQGLRELLDNDVMADVMALMNSPLGFLTDRDPSKKVKNDKTGKWESPNPYPLEVVRDCTIVALLSGFQVTGNEWNIISGKFYAAKDGLRARVEQWPGLRNLQIDLGVPHTTGVGALVPCEARWTLDGKPYSVTCRQADGFDNRICVRVNSGMGADAILGKARRKLYALVLERLTGIGQGDDDDVTAGPVVDEAGEPPSQPGLEQDAETKARRAEEISQQAFRDIAAADAISDVNAITKAAMGAIGELYLDDQSEVWHLDRLEITSIERKDAIKESRGQRSNGKA